MPIDAALSSGSKTYFFSGGRYIRVTRGETGPGTVDGGYPGTIASGWRWPDDFGRDGIDAALDSGSKTYFFSGDRYIRVTRGDTGAGTVDPGYPAHVSAWGWPDDFGRDGIDAALPSGSKTYFFSGGRYIRVTRGETGPGTVDPGYPAHLSVWRWPSDFYSPTRGLDAALYSGSRTYFFFGGSYIRVTRGETGPGTLDANYPRAIASGWGWPDGFGRDGIDAALHSGSKSYFFSGGRYIRVTRGDSGAGTVDPGYPGDISAWGWPDGFGRDGIDAALHSGSKTYFFSGDRYIRVTRGDTGAGTVDPGYPRSIASGWGWPDGFGRDGIDAALHSGSKTYFFSGDRYIRVTRGDTG
ncbi:hemopexin repeat-containing protein, partial [uncultured Ornithinimicrobium sp.]|uniref:hemopexin repeat-containing protein n=1 Tax=uncultured Ornithinimicrobium sp. TaxID=259307 RepID=UPI002599B663